MELKELRNKCHLTQAQASKLVGMPLRTYVRYENGSYKKDSLKYKHAIEVLTNYCLVDETRGILAFEDLKSKVSSVCKQNDVDFCILFGSYSKGKATEKSDVDLLLKTNAKGIAFYGLVEDLRQSLSKKVDVLRVEDLDGNTALLSEIFRDGVKIYNSSEKHND